MGVCALSSIDASELKKIVRFTFHHAVQPPTSLLAPHFGSELSHSHIRRGRRGWGSLAVYNDPRSGRKRIAGG